MKKIFHQSGKYYLIFLIFSKIKKKNNIVIINTYMGHFSEILLYIKTKTFPFFYKSK